MKCACLFLSVLLVSNASAYTIVLRSGRHVTGDLIAQSESTYQLRDPQTRVILSYKTSQVDQRATVQANASDDATPPARQDAVEQPIRVAELARRLRQQRTGQSRVYTTADLDHAPAISIAGGESAETDEKPVAGDGGDSKSEQQWRKEARLLRKEVETAQDRYASAGAACQKARARQDSARAGGHSQPVDLSRLMDLPAECARVQELALRLEQAKERRADFEERARRAAIPWSWLEN